MKEKVSRIITALLELQGKGYFDISFNCEGHLFQVRIYKGKYDVYKLSVYYASIDLSGEEGKLDGVFNMVEALKSVPTKDTNNVMITTLQCYRQEIVEGKKSGNWIKILPIIEYGRNATQSMLIDGSGYYLDDPDNGMLYFVDYEIKKTE
ncbi:MAG: hypothetical protein LBL13_05085 [Bacteroidales bacterium]|jgi:hypothetical protein|nr:hypothetical protein [Bacteroidales bacterium]